jgi:hypothetical protein
MKEEQENVDEFEDGVIDVPPVRVRFYNQDCDEVFDGTVIAQELNKYVVIPDYNLQLTVRWEKIHCDILR